MSAEWSDCDRCEATVKSDNLERHVREVHPREYLGDYPDAPERLGIAPCPECWEWCSLDKEVAQTALIERDDRRFKHTISAPGLELHIATEHPGSYDEHNPDSCIVCTLGYVNPFWPPLERNGFDEDVPEFLWDGEGELRIKAAAAWMSDDSGAEVSPKDIREHEEEGHGDPVIEGNEERAYAHELAGDVWGHLKHPTELEVEVFVATEPGEEYTFPELAELTGRSVRGLRKREDDLTREGILEVVQKSRPKTFRATGEHDYNEDHFYPRTDLGDSDPVETDATGHEDFESLYGHQYETTGAGL